MTELEMWFAADSGTIVTISTPAGPIVQATLPAIAKMVTGPLSSMHADRQGEVLRFTSMEWPFRLDPDDLGDDEDQEPEEDHAAAPITRSYRLLIQESQDQGKTWH